MSQSTPTSTSRILVKNLPKYFTPEKLKIHILKSQEKEGKTFQITDLKLVRAKNGISRRFAYIGFKTNQQGLDAVAYFNNTFIDTCKIQVEIAKTMGDESIDRPWSKYSAGSSANKERIAASTKKDTDKDHDEKENASKPLNDKEKQFLAEIDSDEDFKEFAEVMRPRQAATSRTWGNDDVTAIKAKEVKAPALKTEDDDLYQDLPSKQVVEEEEQDKVRPEVDAENKDDAKIAFDTTLSDMDYLKMKMQQSKEKEEEAEKAPVEKMKVNPERLAILQQGGAVGEVENTLGQEIVQEVNDKVENNVEDDAGSETLIEPHSFVETPSPELIADTGRIMVRNLAFSCTYEDLVAHFKPFGAIAEIHLPMDKITKECKGYAFVLYVIPENAVNAFTTLDKTIFQGRILEIVAAKEKPRSDEIEVSSKESSFKAKKEKERKERAGSDFNWNSLFMNSDAVADAMARNLGVRKSDILDANADNMAVRLALAETNIISETKKYLEENGVSLTAFTTVKTKSPTIILVKNIPSSTSDDDLIDLFSPFGTLGRALLPPARTIALVEYSDRNEAKVAFRKLAYTKFKGVPLYLQWAPEGTFESAFDPKKAPVKKDNTIKIAQDDDVEEDENSVPAATVFVKNLNFETSDDGLRAAFVGVGGLRSARVSTKSNPRVPGQKQSMGFGFLEFETKDDAMKCIKTMQKFNLDGHELALKFSNNATKTSQTSRKRAALMENKEDCTKLLVRNLPFEATKKDLKQLFSSFGSVKTVRVPKKFDGQHRGFGFVDFLTPQEAKNAFESLGATHLYGRHLVIEWAKEEETIEEMRDKVAKGFSKDAPPKKRRIEMGDEMDQDY